jgi:hypothetical protein
MQPTDLEDTMHNDFINLAAGVQAIADFFVRKEQRLVFGLYHA